MPPKSYKGDKGNTYDDFLCVLPFLQKVAVSLLVIDKFVIIHDISNDAASAQLQTMRHL